MMVDLLLELVDCGGMMVDLLLELMDCGVWWLTNCWSWWTVGV